MPTTQRGADAPEYGVDAVAVRLRTSTDRFSGDGLPVPLPYGLITACSTTAAWLTSTRLLQVGAGISAAVSIGEPRFAYA